MYTVYYFSIFFGALFFLFFILYIIFRAKVSKLKNDKRNIMEELSILNKKHCRNFVDYSYLKRSYEYAIQKINYLEAKEKFRKERNAKQKREARQRARHLENAKPKT